MGTQHVGSLADADLEGPGGFGIYPVEAVTYRLQVDGVRKRGTWVKKVG